MSEEVLNKMLAKALKTEVTEIEKDVARVKKEINLWYLSPSEFGWMKNRMATLKSALVRASWMIEYVSKWDAETKRSYIEAARQNNMLYSQYSRQELQKLVDRSRQKAAVEASK